MNNSELEHLIQKNKVQLINIQDSYGNTALHKAALKGNTKLAKQLIKQGVDVNAKDKHDKIALISAAGTGNLDATAALIKNKLI